MGNQSRARYAQEYITHEAGSEEAWICICGNRPDYGGFYPCDENGNEVEPIRNGPWKGRLYVCAKCKRIVDQSTLAVMGLSQTATMLD